MQLALAITLALQHMLFMKGIPSVIVTVVGVMHNAADSNWYRFTVATVVLDGSRQRRTLWSAFMYTVPSLPLRDTQ